MGTIYDGGKNYKSTGTVYELCKIFTKIKA